MLCPSTSLSQSLIFTVSLPKHSVQLFIYLFFPLNILDSNPMDTPSSIRRVTRSQALAASKNDNNIPLWSECFFFFQTIIGWKKMGLFHFFFFFFLLLYFFTLSLSLSLSLSFFFSFFFRSPFESFFVLYTMIFTPVLPFTCESDVGSPLSLFSLASPWTFYS